MLARTATLLAIMLVTACAGGTDPATETPAVVSATPESAATAIAPDPAPTATATESAPNPSPTPEAQPAQPSPTSASAAPTATSPPTPSPEPLTVDLAPVDAQLVEDLRSGGFIIYVHIATSGDDSSDLDTCIEQRVLDDAAQSRARAIGVAFQQLSILAGRVVSGESCTEAVAAHLVYGHSEPLETFEATLSAGVGTGTNLVIFADLADELPVPGWRALEPGETAVLRREGDAAAMIAIVQPEDWPMLVGQVNGPAFQQYPVPPGSRPHDVAPAADGGVWYTAQGSGELGWLDPVTGETRHIPLGTGSAPHGVIVGPDGAPWITDSGLNAIVRVDPQSYEVQVFGLPQGTPGANLNTAAFDGNGIHWFTGQTGYYGRVDPATGEMQVWEAPRGRGPYGIDATPDGDIYYASLAGSHIAQVDISTGEVTVIDPPTAGQGARRVWSDSQGRIWVSEWNSGQVSVYDPASGEWREWRLPGANPMTYAVYVDDRDIVWLSDFGANALVRFDPQVETFEVFPLPATPSNVRQILGRLHEVWGAESAADTLVVLRVP